MTTLALLARHWEQTKQPTRPGCSRDLAETEDPAPRSRLMGSTRLDGPDEVSFRFVTAEDARANGSVEVSSQCGMHALDPA